MTVASNSAGPTRLGELLQPWLPPAAGSDPEIVDVTLDSRRVAPGAMFLALPGASRHGLEFTDQALQRGAVAVVWDDAGADTVDAAGRACERRAAAFVHLPGLRGLAGEIAARFHGAPSEVLPVVGVTGTDGKTSVTQFLAQALGAAGTACGVVGTLGYGLHGGLRAGAHTTPDATDLQRLLAEMHRAGAGAVAMEVSSHALDQERVAGVSFACAVLTNLSRDHLDYHGSEAAYADAKARLFRTPGLSAAVLNVDDALGRRVAGELAGRVRCLRYSMDPRIDAEVVSEAITQDEHGLALQVRANGRAIPVRVPLLGRFNVANVLATTGALLALGRTTADLAGLLGALRPVPGRMERFGGGDRPAVIVDYAHTPAALEAALAAVRAHFPGRVWCVFGCGGNRDRGKRPLMGRAVARLADHVVITDDNPRNEDPDRIVGEIREGIEGGFDVRVERDRGAAIALALQSVQPGDAVLVAGKGHEAEQILGDERRPFSDRATVRELLGEVSR